MTVAYYVIGNIVQTSFRKIKAVSNEKRQEAVLSVCVCRKKRENALRTAL